MPRTIIEEHFVALHLFTPLKTLDKLDTLKVEIEEYKTLNSNELEKYKKWNDEYQELLDNIQNLNSKLLTKKNNKLNLWDFGKFKPSSVIIWPLRFIGSSFITLLFAPVILYKKNYGEKDIGKSITEATESFNNTHPDFQNFIDSIIKKEEKFIKEKRKELKAILDKSISVIDFKGNIFDYNKYIYNLDSFIRILNDELKPYYLMVDEVLLQNVKKVMNEKTIKLYIIDFLTDSTFQSLFEHNYEIDELRYKLENRYKDRTLSIEDKDWKTSIDIIKAKLKITD
ncbi:MAG: hypothetical protein GX675_02400 [Erysipelotrichaceae bacterium]|nr:hypothetical protein [Erysipelotrichaceae bacterium]